MTITNGFERLVSGAIVIVWYRNKSQQKRKYNLKQMYEGGVRR